MKKTNMIILIATVGFLSGNLVWGNEEQPSAAQRPNLETSLQNQTDLQQHYTQAESAKQSCLSDAMRFRSGQDEARARCEADYQNRINIVDNAARDAGITPAPRASAGDILCTEKANQIAQSIVGMGGTIPAKKGDDSYPGSSIFQRCSKHTHLDWAEVVKSDDPNIWNLGWKNFAKKIADEFSQNASGCDKLKPRIESLPSALKDFANELVFCEAVRKITSKSDFNDSKQIIGGKTATQTSLDQKIKCNSTGAETRDYKACVKTLNFYNGALVGTTVFTQVQELGYQGHTIENSVLDPNDPTAGLKSQKKDIEKRAGMTQTRAGLDMAKGAALLALWQSIPTAQDVTKECAAGNESRIRIINDKYLEFINKIKLDLTALSSVPDLRISVDNAVTKLNTSSSNGPLQPNSIAKSCRTHVSGNYVILNTEARDAIKEAMILAGIDGIKHQTAASLLKKQANEVGKVINEVDNFNPTGLEYFGEEFSGSECALNPAAEGCDDFVNQRSFGFGSNAPIQIHGMENASNFGRNNEAANPTSRDSETSPVDRSDAPKPIGIFDPAAENPSGILDPQGAASVSNDGAGAGGASGGSSGGGVAGGGSPPPAPGGAPNSQAPRMGLPNAGNSNLAYSRGTGAIRAGGGRGAQGSRGAEGDGSENPFAGLFGKENPEGANLNFRGSASEEGEINSPDTSIFQIISDRYIAVHGNDRLLMYEAQEEQGPLQ